MHPFICLWLFLSVVLCADIRTAPNHGVVHRHYTDERLIGRKQLTPHQKTVVESIEKELHAHIAHRKQHGQLPHGSRYANNKWVPHQHASATRTAIATASVVASFDATSLSEAIVIIPPTTTNVQIVEDPFTHYCLDVSYNASVVLSTQTLLSRTFTKSAWVRLRSIGNMTVFQSIISSDFLTSGGQQQHTFGISPGGALTASEASASVSTTFGFGVNTWTHVATSFDGTQTTLYVNGNKVAQKRCPCAAKTWQGNGAQPIYMGLNLDGCIQHVKVWDGSLSDAEIQNEYASYVLLTQPPPTTQTPTTTMAPTATATPTPTPTQTLAPTVSPTTAVPTVTTAPTLNPTTVAPTPSPTLTPSTPVPTATAPTTGAPTTPMPTTPSPTNQPPPSTPAAQPLTYHQGSVITSPSLYYVYYGNWSALDPFALTLLPEFAANLGGTPQWNTVSTYYQTINGVNTSISNSLVYKGYSIDMSYAYGKTITDTDVYYIIKNQFTAGYLPLLESNGIYLLLTSPDVTDSSGLCFSYCGWHTSSTINSVRFRYGLIGSGSRCPGQCGAVSSPNTNATTSATNADGMVSIIFHEAAEATTDPDFTAWYDVNSNECADK